MELKNDLAKIKTCTKYLNGNYATDNYSPENCPHYDTDVRIL